MRSLAYALCFILIGVPVVLSTLVWALGLVGVPLPHAQLLSLPFLFGSLVPPMFAFLVPLPVHVVLGYAMLFLVLRRSWLFVAGRRERQRRSSDSRRFWATSRSGRFRSACWSLP